MKKRIAILIVLLIAAALIRRYGRVFHKQSTFSGTLELTEHSLGARTSGRLTQMLVKEGDHVKKGQLLGTLDRYEQALRDFERTEKLFHKGGTTRQMLEQAQLTLEDQKIVAPLDAVVLIKVREIGEVVPSGGAVLDLGNRQDMWIRVFVPEGQISHLRLDQPAVIRIDGVKERFQGHVSYIPPKAEFTPRNVQSPDERVMQTFGVKVAVDNPPEYLRPGVSGDVEFSH